MQRILKLNVLLGAIALIALAFLLFQAHQALMHEQVLLQEHGFDRTIAVYGKQSGKGGVPDDSSHPKQTESKGLMPRFVTREAIDRVAQLSSVERVFKVASNYSRLDVGGVGADVRVLMVDPEFVESFKLGEADTLEDGLVLANAPLSWKGAAHLRVPDRLFNENPNLPPELVASLKSSAGVPVQISEQRYAPFPGGVAGEVLAYSSRTSIDLPQFMQPATIYLVRLESSAGGDAQLSAIRKILSGGRASPELVPEAQFIREFLPAPLLSYGMKWLDKAPAYVLMVFTWMLVTSQSVLRFRSLSLEMALRVISGRSILRAIVEAYSNTFLQSAATVLLMMAGLLALGVVFHDLAFAAVLAAASVVGLVLAVVSSFLLGRIQLRQSPLAIVAGNHD